MTEPAGEVAEEEAPPPAAEEAEAEDGEGQKEPELTAEERLVAKLQADDSLTELDFSSQGLTMAPSSLFTKSHITVLNLSSNNIRGLPAEVCQLTSLRILNLSRNGLRCAHPKDFTSLPRELEAIATLVELRLSECSLLHVPPAVWSVAGLQRLDISRNRIGSIPAEIMQLERLVHLNATQTGLKSLPEEIVCCDRLEELLLFGNPLESLPDTLRDLQQLHKLHINCRVFAAKVDADTESMLLRQQLQSEHIPSVLFSIPRLSDLDLEACKLNQLPNSVTRSLQELNIAENLFSTFPEAVCSLRRLTQLNISKNNFTELPPALKQLQSLRCLLAVGNSIADISVVCHLTQLQRLDLSNNCVRTIPESISQLQLLTDLLLPGNKIEKIPLGLCQLLNLSTLDLTANCISCVPKQMQQMTGLRTAHQFKGLFKEGLWLHRNPIVDPPPKVWNTWDPNKIWLHMQCMEIQNVPKLRACKLIFLGQHQSGKTSLINALRLGRPQPTAASSGCTLGFATSSWESENKCKFVLLEAGGHWMFEPLVPKLLDPKAVHCLVFDASEYQREGFGGIRRWLQLLSSHVPGAAVLLIGTKIDLCCSQGEEEEGEKKKEEQEDELTASLQEELAKFAQSWEAEVEVGFPESEEARRPLRIFQEIQLVSACGHLPGLQRLRHRLELLTFDPELAPLLRKYVPANWASFAEAMKRLPGLYLPWEQLEQLAETKNIRGGQLQECVQYLADTCRVIWLARHPRLHKIVLHRPQLLLQFLGRLLPIHLDAFLDFSGNALFKSRGQLSEEQFAEAREAAVGFGQLSWPLLRCLTFGIGGSGQVLAEALHCVEFLELGCCTPPPAVPQPAGMHSRPVLTLPQLLAASEADAEEAEAAWSELTAGSQHRAELLLRFPLSRPPALLSAFSSNLHAICVQRIDWAGCVYCEVDHCHLLLAENELDDQQLCYSVRARLQSVSQVKLQQMLQWLRHFVQEELQFAPGLLCHISEL